MRGLMINLETTSRCNRKCIVCPQAFEDSGLVTKDMSLDLLDLLLKRVLEALREGVAVREIINAGYGETFIHAKFQEVCERYAGFKAELRAMGRKTPLISIVSNASQMDDARLDLAVKAVDILKLSFPTCDPEHYGEIMIGNRDQGARLLEIAKTGLAKCMTLHRDGKIPELRIHISPPTRHTHENFPQTIDFLTRLAASVGLDHLRVVPFASTSNRAGSVKEASEPDEAFLSDLYRDHWRLYHKRNLNGVHVTLLEEFRVFFPSLSNVLSVLTHRFPCVWKAGSMAIDSSGNFRLCINDVASQAALGNLHTDSIATIVQRVKTVGPAKICVSCNQHPKHISGNLVRWFYATAAKLRMRMAGTTRPR